MTEDAIDRMIERAAREEQEEIDRSHGQHILDVTDYSKERQEDPVLEALRQAQQAKASEAEADKE
jgi:hypothetical protein